MAIVAAELMMEAEEALENAKKTYDEEKSYSDKMNVENKYIDGSWTKIRSESSSLVYLSAESTNVALKIMKFVKKRDVVIDRINELVDLEEEGRLDSKIKRRHSQLQNLSKKSMSEGEKVERKIYLENKLVGYKKQKDDLLRKATLEHDLVSLEASLTLMREAEVLHNKAVALRVDVFILRAKKLKEGPVKITGSTDVRSVMQILASKASFTEFELKFSMAKTPRSEDHDGLCKQMTELAKKSIVVESGKLYKLHIGEGHVHFSHLPPSPATIGFVE